MSDRDAYEDGMGIGRSTAGPDIDRLLATGGDPADPDRELAAFVHAIRGAHRCAPGPALASRHLAEIRAAAAGLRAADVGPRHAARVLPARRLTLALAAIAVSLPLLTAGLAVAGVKLPGFASSAFEQVGLELPNQAAAGAADSGQGAGALANDGAGSPADGARGEVGDERRKGARGGEASRFGRCVSRASRAGAAHPGRRCAHLKKGKAKGKAKAIGKGQAKGKGQAPGSSGGKPGKGPAKEAKAPKDKPKKAKPDSPGKSGSAPGKAKPDDKDKGKHGTKGPGKGTGGAKKK